MDYSTIAKNFASYFIAEVSMYLVERQEQEQKDRDFDPSLMINKLIYKLHQEVKMIPFEYQQSCHFDTEEVVNSFKSLQGSIGVHVRGILIAAFRMKD